MTWINRVANSAQDAPFVQIIALLSIYYLAMSRERHMKDGLHIDSHTFVLKIYVHHT